MVSIITNQTLMVISFFYSAKQW